MTKHLPAITEPARFGAPLRAIDHCAAMRGLRAAPVQLSVRAVGWRRTEVDHWTAEGPQVLH